MTTAVTSKRSPYKPHSMDRSWRPASPNMGQVKERSFLEEAAYRLPELDEPFRFLAVGGGWVAGDFVGHQLLDVTKGDKTKFFYYGNKLLWSIPFLLVGRLLSDYVVKGSTFARALTIGTTANALMQVRYLFTSSPEFNVAVFLIHEAVVVPLSLLIVGPSPATGFHEGAY